MAEQLKVCETEKDFGEAVERLGETDVILAKYGAGLLDSVGVVFYEYGIDDVYAQYNVRESGGRGPHFDVYDGLLAPEWLGHYELAGSATIRTTVLPADFQESYFDRYPVGQPHGEAAYNARRLFSQMAFDEPGVEVFEGHIEQGTGFVLPANEGGPYVVHEITPDNDDEPGAFVKLIVPRTTPDALSQLDEYGYQPLDKWVTKMLVKAALPRKKDRREQEVPRPVKVRPYRWGKYDLHRTID